MNERTESVLRQHLQSVESAPLPSVIEVGDGVARVERRFARRRRALSATAAVVIVGLGAGVLWNTSASPQEITGADGVPSSTASVSPLSTDVVPTTIDPNSPWSAIPSYNKPIDGATVVWTGTEAWMIGGRYKGGPLAGITAYNPSTEEWRTVSSDIPLTENPLVFWTGTSLVLLSGSEQAFATFDPIDGLTSVQMTSGKALFYVDATTPSVWTGTELLVWPTAMQVFPAPQPVALEPVSGESRPLADIPLESRANAASIWTGTEWIIWGGSRGQTYFNDGAAYNPATDTWRLLPKSPLGARRAPAIWTGSEMIITAGFYGDPASPGALADGAAYDPVSDTWREIAPGLAHPGFAAVWTGELIVLFAKGGAVWYDPADDEWSSGDFTWGSVAHLDQHPVWTGEVVVLLGSYDASTGGATFTPPET